MLFPLAGFMIGLIWGALRAKTRGGTRADKVQWALVHGIAFALAGLFLLILVDRLIY